MLIDIRSDDPVGAVDIYPHANRKQEAAIQPRLTVIYGKVYYRGYELDADAMQRRKERVLELEAAFKVAQRVVEAERATQL